MVRSDLRVEQTGCCQTPCAYKNLVKERLAICVRGNGDQPISAVVWGHREGTCLRWLISLS